MRNQTIWLPLLFGEVVAMQALVVPTAPPAQIFNGPIEMAALWAAAIAQWDGILVDERRNCLLVLVHWVSLHILLLDIAVHACFLTARACQLASLSDEIQTATFRKSSARRTLFLANGIK